MSQSTYDPGPVPEPTAQDRLIARRIRAIAAIHAFAQWFTDHPDAPIPAEIMASADPATALHAPDAERQAALERFARDHGARRHRHGPHEFADLDLATEEHHGIRIAYAMSMTLRGQGRR
jgi:hypothetical protein